MRTLVIGWVARGAGLALGVGVVWLVAGLASKAGNVLLLLFFAILLAAALEPFVGWLRARLPVGRSATILIVYVAFFALVAVLALLVLPSAFAQGERIVRRLPLLVDELRAFGATVQPDAIGRAIVALADAAESAFRPATPDTQEVVEVGLTLAEVLASIATVLALVFFWLVGHARLQRYLLAFLPPDRRAEVRDTWNEVETRLGLWVRGQLILMATVGVLSGIAYALLGVPAALLLAVIAGLAEAVPLVGPLIGAAPAILAAGTVSIELAIIVAGVALVIQVVENNILVPHVMRNTIGLSPLVVTIALLVGGAVGGIGGALVAVPLMAGIDVIVGRLQDRDTPIAQEPAGTADPDAETSDDLARTLPDAPGSATAR